MKNENIDNMKSVASLLAELRELGENRDLAAHGAQSNKQRLNRIADRLEAAAKREFPTIEKSSAVGSAAAIREALEKIVSLCGKRDYPVVELEEIEAIAMSALALPSRNCDRFKYLYEAAVAWGREEQGWEDWPDEDMEDCNDLINVLTGDQEHELLDWLFAHATERKGEVDGRK